MWVCLSARPPSLKTRAKPLARRNKGDICYVYSQLQEVEMKMSKMSVQVDILGFKVPFSA